MIVVNTLHIVVSCLVVWCTRYLPTTVSTAYSGDGTADGVSVETAGAGIQRGHPLPPHAGAACTALDRVGSK